MRDSMRVFWVRWGEAFAYPAVLSLIGLLAIVATYCTGCGSQWDAHAIAAQTLRDAAQEANTRIREDRREALRTAGGEALAHGGDVGAAIDAAAVRYDAERAPLFEAQRILTAASTAYSAGAFAAAQGRGGDALLQLAQQAGRAWVALTRALNIPELESAVPPELLEFLGVGGTP